MLKTKNQKYEITDIPHENYPFLHRIRALRDIGTYAKAGDLGGFVESESNLSAELSDCAWIADDAIAAGDAYVDKDSCLREKAIACDSAYVSRGSILSGSARAEDNAYLRGAALNGSARVSGFAQVIRVPDQLGTPLLTDRCQVYGTLRGEIRITGAAVILPGEEIRNDTKDAIVISEKGRSIIRSKDRDMLKPSRMQRVQEKKQKKWRMER